nr:type VI secretion system tip protein VgrG [uncultured Chryseobacterium sp.]
MKRNSVIPASNAMSNARINHPDDIARYLSKKTFKNFLADKRSPLVYCTLTIDGKDFLAKNSYTVEFVQHTNDHDTFSIITPDDSLDSFEGYIMENSKNLLGKNINISLHRFGKTKQTFSGIITKIKNKRDEGGGYGKLHIMGYSPSILLENGKDCQSFENKTLEQIISQTTSWYPQEAQIKVKNPNTRYEIPYTVQYKESDYQFIKRLAIRYGEYFYYDGERMVFGDQVQPTVVLAENVDLIDVEFDIMIQSQNFNYLAYDPISARVKEKDSDSVIEQYKENPIQAVALNTSKRMYKKKPDMLFDATSQQRVDRDVEEMVKRKKEKCQHLIQVKGKSRDPELRIGSLAEISDINNKAMETYRIIHISHFHNGNEYHNEFIGVPDVYISPYFNEDAYPNTGEQVARVTDNEHPQGMVRVQFPWQIKNGEKTPWLRMVTPYAGAGKGLHIIPEVGEEVLVGFDSANAERPYVIGAMFNGEEMSGYGTPDNRIKAIHTRSGTKLIMNDAEGSVHIEDPSGNTCTMDGKGNTVISAPNNMILNAGDNMVFNAGCSAILNACAGTVINTTNMMQFITNTSQIKAGDVNFSIDGDFTVDATNIALNSIEKFGAMAKEANIGGKEGVKIEGCKINMSNCQKESKKECKTPEPCCASKGEGAKAAEEGVEKAVKGVSTAGEIMGAIVKLIKGSKGFVEAGESIQELSDKINESKAQNAKKEADMEEARADLARERANEAEERRRLNETNNK